MKTNEKLIGYVSAYMSGDRDSFAGIYEESGSYLYTCIRKIVGDEDVAPDLLQETYLEIVKSSGQLQNPEAFLSWAATIANRKCFRYLQKKQPMLPMEEEEGLEEIPDGENIIPESILEEQEKSRLIREIVDGLTPMQRLCVIGYFYQEKKQEEIAKELEIPLNTVKTNLSRAKARIKAAVEELETKQGTKLYSFPAFFALFFRMEESGYILPGIIWEEFWNRLGGVQGREELPDPKQPGSPSSKRMPDAKPGKLSVGAKIGAGVAAAVAVVAGAAVIGSQSGKEAPAPKEPQIVVAQEEVPAAEEAVEEPVQEPAAEETSAPEPIAAAVTGGTLEELFAKAEEYARFGSAYGGMIPVQKGELWGAVNYRGEEVIPVEYSIFSAAPDTEGCMVLGNRNENGEALMTLFDGEGKVKWQGSENQTVSASSGAFRVKEDLDGELMFTYYDKDGNEFLKVSTFFDIGGGTPFYNGEALAVSGEENADFYRISAEGTYETIENKRYAEYLQDVEEIEKNEEEVQSGEREIIYNGTQGAVYAGAPVVSPLNNGYYAQFCPVSNSISLCDAEQNVVANLEPAFASVENHESLGAFQGVGTYFIDGAFLWNYGSLMALRYENGTLLVDFSKQPYSETGIDEISAAAVVGVYDSITMNDSPYWLVSEEESYAFIDRAGNKVAEYTDATSFYRGVAMVMEDGKAYVINENFEKLSDGIAADSVDGLGELFAVTGGDTTMLYRFTAEGEEQ